MPVLSNAKHELFAQGVAKGKTQTQAFIDAGYSADTAYNNANRLMENDGIVNRIRELQERMAIKVEITALDIINELEQAREIAMQEKQTSSMVSASMGKAKLLGLITDKLQSNVNLTIDSALDAIADEA